MKIQISLFAFMLQCLLNSFATDAAQPVQLQIIDLNAVQEIFEERVAAVNLMGLTTRIDERQNFDIHSRYIQNILGRLPVPGYVVVHEYDGRIRTMCTKKLTTEIFALWHDSYKKSFLYKFDYSTAENFFSDVYDVLSIAMRAHGQF